MSPSSSKDPSRDLDSHPHSSCFRCCTSPRPHPGRHALWIASPARGQYRMWKCTGVSSGNAKLRQISIKIYNLITPTEAPLTAPPISTHILSNNRHTNRCHCKRDKMHKNCPLNLFVNKSHLIVKSCDIALLTFSIFKVSEKVFSLSEPIAHLA